jgi:Ca2+-binding RTX toxin-like protein
MKRIVLLTALAAMMAAAMALSGVAQAKPITEDKADKKCLVEAVRTVEQPGFKPAAYTFFGGTEDNDTADLQRTEGPDVFCGFGGNDLVGSLDPGDIFLGGAGGDSVGGISQGTFYGGEGDDTVLFASQGSTFNGGEGNDEVTSNFATFNGEAGDDFVEQNAEGATFNGGPGIDTFGRNEGTFVQ